MPKLRFAASVPGDRLEHQIDRHSAIDRLDRRRDMGQDAGLRRNLVGVDHVVEHSQQRAHGGHAVCRGIDADHRIAAAIEQAVKNAGGDAGRIVGRMVRLQPRRKAPGQADGVAETRYDAAFAGDEDQILHAHELRNGGYHFRRQAGRELRQRRFVGRRPQQPIAEIADGEAADRGEGAAVVFVDDQPRHLVLLIGNQRFVEKDLQGRVGERHLRRDAL